MTRAPSFSIVIPTFERRDMVCETIRALNGLDYDGAIDIIVAIDGSTDGTADAVARVDSRFPVKLLELDHGGAAHARNRGAAEARGEIILFLDDDMRCEPDLVLQHSRTLGEGADAVVGEIRHDESSPPGFVSDAIRLWVDASRSPPALTPFEVFTGQLSVRRQLFEQLGGFDERFTSGGRFANEDADFGVRLLDGHDVRRNPQAITHQRYVVTLAENLARAPRAAAGDVHFLAKHPQFTAELLKVRGANRPMTRFVYRPSSRIPLLPQVLGAVALRLGGLGLRSPFRSSRALRYLFGAARQISYWSAVRASGGFPGSRRLLVLCYHAIQDQSADPVLAPFGVPPNRFAEQLRSLLNRGYVFVGPQAVAAFVNQGAPLPRRAVLLTFDDCYADLLGVARDVLRPRGIEAVAFAVTNLPSGTNEWDQPAGAAPVRLLDRDQLRELAALGVEVGAHSRTHRPMPELSEHDRMSEASGARDDLAKDGLPPPRFFAYPYGAADRASIEAVRKAGYIAGFGVASRRVDSASDRYRLPRVPVMADDRGIRFRLKTGAPRLFGWIDGKLNRAYRVIDAARPRLA